MKTLTCSLILATLPATQVMQAQQSPSPAPPTPQMQAQPAPCAATSSPAQKTKVNNSSPTLIDRWKKKLNEESAKVAKQTGVPMPTTDDLGQLVGTNPAPCPPKVVAPAPPAASAQSGLVRLPADTTVTLHCNPLTPSPQGGIRQTTLTLPDPKDFALPRANDFLVDSVVPDTAAKTPCYLMKVDPKTGKSFVQQ